MYKIRVYTVGKTKESWLREALSEYQKRLQSTLTLEWVLAKNDLQLQQLVEKEAHFICLDPAGRQFSSEEFSSFLMKSLCEGHARLIFVIGGAEGIPAPLKARARSLISLSRMTLTHQITRLVLVEQIYRALEIDRGSAYHK